MANYLDETGLQALRTRLEAVYRRKDASISVAISDVSGLQTALDGKVPTIRTVNGKALSDNITLTASDVGVPVSSITFSNLGSSTSPTITSMNVGELKFCKSNANVAPTVKLPSGGTYYVIFYMSSQLDASSYSGGSSYKTYLGSLVYRKS